MLTINLDEYLIHTGFTRDGGEGIGIAIIDTGCNLNNSNILYQYNAFYRNKDITDKNGHGTSIYSIINSIAPKSNYYIMKGLDDYGSGSMLAIYECLIRCRDNDDIDIICLSLSSFNELSHTTLKALKECLSEGKMIFSSLGNDNSKRKTYPSSIEGVYSVGGLNKDLSDKFETSNYSTDTSFVALGENIKVNDKILDGTSFANAIVIGQVAEILSYGKINPKDFNYNDFNKYFRKNYRELNTAYGSLYKEVL